MWASATVERFSARALRARPAVSYTHLDVYKRQVIISVDPDFIRIIAVYQYGEKEIKVTVRRYNSEDALERFSLEKQEGQQDTKYTKDGVVHSIAQNNAACTASWTNGLNMASIMGDVTEEELEQMIDSIYT